MNKEERTLLKRAMIEIADKIYNSIIEERYMKTALLIKDLEKKLKEEDE